MVSPYTTVPARMHYWEIRNHRCYCFVARLKVDSGPWPTGPERIAHSIRYVMTKSFRSY